MKKMKDFEQFLNEMKSENEVNVIQTKKTNESFTEVVANIGGVIGAISATGFVGTLAYGAGSAIFNLLENSELGERGKKFASDIKALFKKGAQIKKNGGDESEFADDVTSELDNYQDVITDLESGKLGEDGKKFAQEINKVKNAAEQAQAE